MGATVILASGDYERGATHPQEAAAANRVSKSLSHSSLTPPPRSAPKAASLSRLRVTRDPNDSGSLLAGGISGPPRRAAELPTRDSRDSRRDSCPGLPAAMSPRLLGREWRKLFVFVKSLGMLPSPRETAHGFSASHPACSGAAFVDGPVQACSATSAHP